MCLQIIIFLFVGKRNGMAAVTIKHSTILFFTVHSGGRQFQEVETFLLVQLQIRRTPVLCFKLHLPIVFSLFLHIWRVSVSIMTSSF